jgi:steroid 5-alpha reductase family enzyme
MMWDSYLYGLAVLLVLAVLGWLSSLALRNVNLVDSLWPLFFLAAAVTYAGLLPEPTPRTALILALVALWALRLAGHLTVRNWGKPEDRRYQAIRANHSPGFAWKSLYIVFGLQAVLAWSISLPLHAAIISPTPPGLLDALGVLLLLAGLSVETLADHQLSRFKRDPANRGRVLDRGLWRYSRHPNYFGEACVWWGFGLLAVAAGAWWALLSPMLMTFLLLRVSGVALLERDIAERRPAYRDYIARTSSFIPWPPRQRPSAGTEEATP